MKHFDFNKIFYSILEIEVNWKIRYLELRTRGAYTWNDHKKEACHLAWPIREQKYFSTSTLDTPVLAYFHKTKLYYLYITETINQGYKERWVESILSLDLGTRGVLCQGWICIIVGLLLMPSVQLPKPLWKNLPDG